MPDGRNDQLGLTHPRAVRRQCGEAIPLGGQLEDVVEPRRAAHYRIAFPYF